MQDFVRLDGIGSVYRRTSPSRFRVRCSSLDVKCQCGSHRSVFSVDRVSSQMPVRLGSSLLLREFIGHIGTKRIIERARPTRRWRSRRRFPRSAPQYSSVVLLILMWPLLERALPNSPAESNALRCGPSPRPSASRTFYFSFLYCSSLTFSIHSTALPLSAS
jgi:hypothetical protein